jgi:hypothetical protein
MTFWRLFWVTVLAGFAAYYFGRHPIQDELPSASSLKPPQLMNTGPFTASKPAAPVR